MAYKLIVNDNLERGKDKDNAVKQDAEFRNRNAEDMRILARCDNIATGEVLNVAEKWRTIQFALSEVKRICESAKSEDEDKYDADTFHTAQHTHYATRMQQ